MPSTNFSPDSLPDLTGKVYVVTGGNTGIGKFTVLGLAARGAKVYLGARSEVKAKEAIEEIRAEVKEGHIEFLPMDLADFKSVLSAARRVLGQESALHGLINNAGIMGVPFSKTGDGYEIQFQTNYLSHWLLTFHLLPLLSATSAASPELSRIVDVTSDGHSLLPPKAGIQFDDLDLEKQSAMTRYGQSKLANVLHAKELNRKYGPSSQSRGDGTGNVCVAAVHPGHINTNLNAQATGLAPAGVLRVVAPVLRCLGVTDVPSRGALSSLWAVASKEFKYSDSGAYVVPYAKIEKPSKYAQDPQLATKLWDWTEKELAGKGLLKR